MSDENIIDDQYQLVMCIASGSSSQVWEVVEQNTARHLAMKLLKKDVDKAEFAENKAQLKREAAILKSLDHPQIVKYDNYSSNRDHTYMLMEHFRASNLKLQIKADTNKVHLRARPLFEGVCSALAYVHQKGFVHRDIKPDNILMNKVGEIRLCDFSLSSKQVTGFGKMMAGKLKVIQGTRTYIAPETIRKEQPSFQTDMYSLGIVFFEVLALRTPFQAPSPEELLQKHLRAEAPNPSEFNPNVAPEMDRLIARLLKKKPADRPANVEEILQELKRIRIFKEDIVDEVEAKKASADTDALAMLSEIRLDSRADAKLKQMLETDPEFARKFAEEKLAKAKVKKAAADRLSDRIKVAEDADAARTKALGKNIAAAKGAPAPQPVAQPMPMPMQGYPMGYPSYPQGYMPYPQGQMPPMPMPPGMAAPFPPGGQQYPVPPQFAYPPQAQQPPVPYPPQMPQPTAAIQPPIPASPLPPIPQPAKPTAPSVAQPAAPAIARPAAQQVAQPAQRPKPQPPVKTVAVQQAPPAGQTKPVAPPPKPVAAVPARPAPKAAPPTTPPVADLDFMTDLPDVL